MGVRMWLVVAALGLMLPQDGEAQRRGGRGAIELSPIVGYQWGGGGQVRRGETRGDIKFAGSAAYGILADFEVRRGAWVEAVVYAQPTTLRFNEVGSTETREIPHTNWYYHIGGLYEAINAGNVKPFAVITLGATQANPRADGIGSDWFFSFSFGGGLKAYFSERVAFRAQARAWVSALSGGTGFYLGTGGAGVSTWIGETSTQGEISAGLSFVL